jgi:RHS repeat-associated protein
MTEYTFTVGTGVDDGQLGWNSNGNGSLSSLTIGDSITGTADSQTCAYGRDDLARLTSVSCGSLWSQTFTFDRWGNLAKSGNQSFSALYASNNRITSNLSIVPHYDQDGNLLDDPSTGAAVNAFDAEGHMTSLEDVNLTYDALGRAVEASATGGATVEFLYDPDGRKLAVMNGQTLVRADFPLPGGNEAAFTSTGVLMYLTHGDNLGSGRLATTPSGGVYSSNAYAPYGEAYAETGTTSRDFTGQKQDIASGSYDFLMRELSQVQGRWWTPDPAGLAAVDANDPQSWNRYAYVGGMPLMAVDPLGLCHAVPGANIVVDDRPGDCVENGNTTATATGAHLAGGGGSGALSAGFSAGPCIVENRLWPGPAERVNGDSAAEDGPYDPGPEPDGCGTNRGGSGSGLPIVGPAQAGIVPPSEPTTPSAQPGVSHCLAAAAEAKGLAMVLDAAGAVPALGNAVSAVSGIARAAIAVDHTITAPAFALAAGTYGSYAAVTAGPGEAVDSLVGAGSAGASIGLSMADLSLGGTKALPVLGNFLSAATLFWDGAQAFKAYQSCMAGH